MQPAKGTEAANLLKMCLQMPICLHKPHGYRAAEERAVLLHFPWDCQKKKKKKSRWQQHAVKLKAYRPRQSAPSAHFCCGPKPWVQNSHSPTVSSSAAVRLYRESLGSLFRDATDTLRQACLLQDGVPGDSDELGFALF